MKKHEVGQLLKDLETQKLKHAYLEVRKPLKRRPKGFKLRTAFGLVEILNVQGTTRNKKGPGSVNFRALNQPLRLVENLKKGLGSSRWSAYEQR